MRDEELATVEGRLARQSEVEEALAEWTIEQDAYDLMIELQERGVVAGVVQKASDLFKDPQLAHRGHFKALDHEEMGTCHYNMPSWRMTDTVLEPRWAAPLLGEHTEMILRTVVGMDDQAIEELRAAGALN